MKMPRFKRYGFSSALVLAGLVAASIAGCNFGSTDKEDYFGLPNEKIVISAVPPPAISGGTLMVTQDDTAAVASDPDRDRVVIVDLEKGAVRSVIPFARGEEPGRVVEDGSGRAHVLVRRAGEIATINIASGALVERRAVCPAPRGVAYEAAADTLHVACEGGEFVSLPAKGGAPTRELRLERDLRDVVLDNGKLLVSRFRSAELLVVDAEGTINDRKVLPTFHATNFSGDQSFAPSVAWRTVAMPGGGVLMAHQRAMTSPVRLVPGSTYYGVSDCDGSILHSAVSIIRSPSGAPSATETMPSEVITTSPLPVDVAVTPDGVDVAMVSAGSNTVVRTRTSSIEKQAGAQQCAPEMSTVDMPGQPVAVAVSPKRSFVVQLREPSRLVFLDGSISIDMGGDSRADTAHDLFHRSPSGTGSIACASCHPEGSQDGRVWMFESVGARRTQTVAMGGMLSQTAPFHWAGDLTDLSALMAEVFSSRMGGGPIGERRSRLMLKWLDTLPAPATSMPADVEAVERGKELFHDAKVACSKCHDGSALTNNRSENVGTGAKLQVPSLIGIASRAPYMHNGCAPTLRDRFDNTACGGGDMHGVTSQLTQTQIDDLIAYLDTL